MFSCNKQKNCSNISLGFLFRCENIQSKPAYFAIAVFALAHTLWKTLKETDPGLTLGRMKQPSLQSMHTTQEATSAVWSILKEEMGCMNLQKAKQFWKGAPSLLSAVLIQIYFSHLATEANLNTLRKQRVFELHLVLLLRSGVVWVCCMGQVEQGHINHCISGTKNFLWKKGSLAFVKKQSIYERGLLKWPWSINLQKLQQIFRTAVLIGALHCLHSRHLLIAPTGLIFFSSSLYDSGRYGGFICLLKS